MKVQMVDKKTGEVIETLSGDVDVDTTVVPEAKCIVHIYAGENEIETLFDFKKGVKEVADDIRKLGLENWLRTKRGN